MMNTNFGSIEKSLNVETSIVPKEETKKPELPNVVLKKDDVETGPEKVENKTPDLKEKVPTQTENKQPNAKQEKKAETKVKISSTNYARRLFKLSDTLKVFIYCLLLTRDRHQPHLFYIATSENNGFFPDPHKLARKKIKSFVNFSKLNLKMFNPSQHTDSNG